MSLGIIESWCMHMTSLQWGDQDAMTGLDTVLRQRYVVKIAGRPSTDNDGNGCEVTCLNHVLRIIHSESRPSFQIEGDPRHAELIASELGLTPEKTKTVDTPETREGMESCASRLLVSPLLSGEDTKQYRTVTRSAVL